MTHLTPKSRGSPPRVRERLGRWRRRALQRRITPACAGKTTDRLITIKANEDHPRVCGKDCTARTGDVPRKGSPPRVRERLILFDPLAVANGITPACAGKTTLSTVSGRGKEDHPRVCGKDAARDSNFWIRPGSPPRVRERHTSMRWALCMWGITPACAGKTLRVSSLSSSTQDHPRVCGKDYLKYLLLYVPLGSPPRVRERPLID